MTTFIHFSPLYRQISIISVDGEHPRSRSVRRHGCSQKKHAEPQEKKKKPHEVEKLIQAETAETGRVSPAAATTLPPPLSHACGL